MRIAFILQVSSHARYWRRIDKLESLGIQSTVFAFERDYYQGSKQDRNYISLGHIEQQNYKKRVNPLIKSISTIRNEIGEVDVIYAFGMDTFFIGWIATLFRNKNVIFVYEVGDIRVVFTKKGFLPKLFRFMEKLLLKKADLLVVTSEAYIKGYFKNIQKIRKLNYHVIENKSELNSDTVNINENNNRQSSKRIRIGYFGILRCLRSLEILRILLKKYESKFELYIRGVVTKGAEIVSELRTMENAMVEGEYKVPDDLPSMYSQIDIIWACYPYMGSETGNWMWAKTTRFYEACFFKKPMITLVGTQDSYFVIEKGIGLALDLCNLNQSVKQLSQLTKSQINEMIKNYDNVSPDVYTYNNEHSELVEKLKNS